MAEVNARFFNKLKDKLRKGTPIHFSLPDKGTLRIDKPLPFLVVYRIPADGRDVFTSRLGRTEASFLHARDNSETRIGDIIRAIATELSDRVKGFLVLEVWLSEKPDKTTFKIHIDGNIGLETGRKLQTELNSITVQQSAMKAVMVSGEGPAAPAGQKPLLSGEQAKKLETILIGLEIAPVYINEKSGQPFPLFLRDLRNQFSKALRKSFFEFIRLHTTYSVSNFQMLGTTQVDDTTLEIDRELAAYSRLFDFLMLVTPINVDEAWEAFRKSEFSENPAFHYRPMPIDPELVKRKLYNLPIEKIPDPTIAFLFRDKRKEIDRMMNMMQEREKPDFRLTSMQLFAPVTEHLLEVAKAILVAVEEKEDAGSESKLSAVEFAQMAEKELKWLRRQDPSVKTEVRLSGEVEGIMVSNGVLHINKNFTVSKARSFGLLQHEIGTHVVTYYNGRAQPFELFSIGVPGYEELQEGLAVMAEYLCKGLTPGRMRTLAARVVAVHEMTAGSNFTDTFHLLTDKYGFNHKPAFIITVRVFRGGGLTKDAVYLKGLLNILEYIKQGKELKRLLIGKIRQDYLPIVEELIHRKILKDIPVIPKFLSEPYEDAMRQLKTQGNIFNLLRH